MIATHEPTGIEARVDGRKQHQNKKQAIRQLEESVAEHFNAQNAAKKKSRRDYAIHNETRIRTYDFSRGIVTDHRTGKKASIKDILGKGLLDKLK